MGAEKDGTLLQRFEAFMEQNTRGVQIFTYGIPSIGLLLALYKVRPFAKFKKPSDIPNHFIKSKVALKGVVVRIEPNNGTVLMVDHNPPIPLPRFGNSRYLPVKIAGLEITGNGISWLQSVVKGQKVTFVPLSKQKEYLNCMVTVLHQNKEPLKIGEEIARLGFGTVDNLPKPLLQEKDITLYQKSLIAAQKWAKRNRNGYWQATIHPTILWKIQKSLTDKLRSVLPVFLLKQLNV